MPPRVSPTSLSLPPSFLAPDASPFLPRSSKRFIRSTFKPRPSRFNHGAGLPVLESSSTAALKRREGNFPLRTGALAIKKGMTAMYDPETGKRTPCTVLQMDRVEVVSHKTRQRHGYWAVQVGCGWKHATNVTRPMLGHFAIQGISPKRHLAEFRVRDEKGLLDVGKTIGATWFQVGQYVDTRSNCKGKGFAGVS
jgi:large subunit ribosomal protein L3